MWLVIILPLLPHCTTTTRHPPSHIIANYYLLLLLMLLLRLKLPPLHMLIIAVLRWIIMRVVVPLSHK